MQGQSQQAPGYQLWDVAEARLGVAPTSFLAHNSTGVEEETWHLSGKLSGSLPIKASCNSVDLI